MASGGPPSLVELANFAKENSPYYRDLYANLEIDEKTPWHSVPAVQHSSYWTSNKDENNAVRTSKLVDGILFKTEARQATRNSSRYLRSNSNRQQCN